MKTKVQNYNYFFNEYAMFSAEIGSQLQIEKNVYSYFKRLTDIVLALLGLIISFPIILLFIFLIKLESPGPAFYFQKRVGLNGKYFDIVKLRSMRIDAEKNGAQWAEKNDNRITKTGSFIRKTRIDELPQFFNILTGDMSLIGPRPERPVFTAQFNEEIPGFINRLKVKPGLTGWAQINGGYDISPEEKLKLDCFYIENMGFLLDIKILFRTIIVCVTGNGAR